MDFLRNIIVKLFGKTVDGKISLASKTKIIAIIAVIIPAIPTISTAFGHPIFVPEWILQTLAALGLWTLRDAINS